MDLSTEADKTTKEDLHEYRSISVAAVLALVLGLASPLVYFGGVLLALPVVTIIVSYYAVQKLKQSEGTLEGKNLILLGFCLAFGSLVFYGVRSHLVYQRLETESAQITDLWFKSLLANQPERALFYTRIKIRKPKEAIPDPSASDEAQEKSEPSEQEVAAAKAEQDTQRMVNFKENELVAALLNRDTELIIRDHDYLVTQETPKFVVVQRIFEIASKPTPNKKYYGVISLYRFQENIHNKEWTWQIIGMTKKKHLK